MKVYAFTGSMESGKTTAVDYLIEGDDSRMKLSFGEPIKRIAKQAFQWDGEKDERGRKLLQDIGRIGRAYNSDIWVDYARTKLLWRKKVEELVEGYSLIIYIDDLRMDEEAYMLRSEFNATIVKIFRPGYNGDGDVTEHGISDSYIDYLIFNDGTKEDLFKKLDKILGRVAIGS